MNPSYAIRGLFVGAAIVLVLASCAPQPRFPPGYEPVYRFGKTYSGRGYLEDRDGVPILHLAGTPAERGRSHGALLAPAIAALSQRLQSAVADDSAVPALRPLQREYLKAYAARMEASLPATVLEEMEGIALGAGTSLAQIVMNAAILDNLLATGPGLQAVVPLADGRPAHAILTGWLGDNIVDGFWAVLAVYPTDGGSAYAAVSWAGCPLPVFGVNERGVSAGVTAAPAGGQLTFASPAGAAVRQILQFNSAFDQVPSVPVLTHGALFVTAGPATASGLALYTLGERSRRASVVPPAVVIPAPPWLPRAARFDRMQREFLPVRQARLEGLVKGPPWPVLEAFAGHLRDRQEPGGAQGITGTVLEVENGAAAFAVTSPDPAQIELWVTAGSAPAIARTFVGIRPFDGFAPVGVLPKASVVTEPWFTAWRRMASGRRALQRGELHAAREHLAFAYGILPDAPEVRYWYAVMQMHVGGSENLYEARLALEAAAAARPPEPLMRRIRAALRRHAKLVQPGEAP